jgi:hypothetical protein
MSESSSQMRHPENRKIAPDRKKSEGQGIVTQHALWPPRVAITRLSEGHNVIGHTDVGKSF